jgi:hypothetical protein
MKRFLLFVFFLPLIGFGQVSFNTSQILDVNNNSYSLTKDKNFVLDNNTNAHIVYRKDMQFFYNNNIGGVFNNETFLDSVVGNVHYGSEYIFIDNQDVIHIFLLQRNADHYYQVNGVYSPSQELLYTNNSNGSFSTLINVLPSSLLNERSDDVDIIMDYNDKIHLFLQLPDYNHPTNSWDLEKDLYYTIFDSTTFLSPILIATEYFNPFISMQVNFSDDVYLFAGAAWGGGNSQVDIWSGDYNQGFSHIQNIDSIQWQHGGMTTTLDNNGYIHYCFGEGMTNGSAAGAIHYGNNLNGSFSYQQIISDKPGKGRIGFDYGYSGIHIGYSFNDAIQYSNNMFNGSFSTPITFGSADFNYNPTLRVDKFGYVHLFWKELISSSDINVYYSKSNQIVDPSILGCTDSTAFNFDATANTDDGSCIYPIYGCTDSTALNFDATANTDDSSCTYQMTYVPDDNFEQALINLGYDDVMDDSVRTASIDTVTYLYAEAESIMDFTGIESFISLTWFSCGDNDNLPSLDVSQNTALTHLNCSFTSLTNIDLSANTALTELSVMAIGLTSLDVTNNTALTYLNCSDNQLTSLDVSNNLALTDLNSSWNQLTILDLSNNIALTDFECELNNLTSLDVSNNIALTHLNCRYNQLTNLDVRNGNNLNLNFTSKYNPTLFCIDVDDPTWSANNWTNIDSWASFSLNCNPIYGCTDSTALNYNPNATIDNGSCIPFMYGCHTV